MTFGNPFGLALYDKQQREVTRATERGERPRDTPTARATSLRTAPPAPATAAALPSAAAERPAVPDPALVPLDPATIHQLHATFRCLPRPVLEGFTKAFRKRFQVPAEAPSIADRICQRRHHDWIEAFLVLHQGTSTPEMVAA